jgi:DNA recombination protein RmuC
MTLSISSALQFFILILVTAAFVGVIYLIRKLGPSSQDAASQTVLIDLEKQNAALLAEKKLLEERIEESKKELNEVEKNLEKERAAHSESKQSYERLDAMLASERKQNEEKINLLNGAQETLKLEFQNLANKIMEEKSEKFTEQNKSNIESLMNPLREQLKDFKKKIEDTYDKETKDRISLHEQIINLQKLNTQLSEDAHNLTKALKGESKTQGNWGELILERILEQSGLEKGREYETQSSFSQSDADSKQKRYQPDVLIHLPEEKTIIVDSKVSLTAYENFCSAEEENDKKIFLKEHINSVKKHIIELSEKTYQDIDALNTLDFVVMFMPIEAAFLLAMQEDQELYRYAMDKNIFIVSPSNLLVMLRTIHHTWRNEKQNQNAQKIADNAGKLYDKFVGFLDDMDDIGKKLEQTSKSWESGMKKLQQGSGNLIKRAEDLKKLGAKANKSIDRNLLKDDSEN